MIIPNEMKIKYLTRRKADLDLLRHELSIYSVEKFNIIGHQLIGSARCYGFESLEPIAKKMEVLKLVDLNSRGPKIISDFEIWLRKQKKF